MEAGYKQHFNKLKQTKGPVAKEPKIANEQKVIAKVHQLKKIKKEKRRKSVGFPFQSIIGLSALSLFLGAYWVQPEVLEKSFQQVEIGIFGDAFAESAPAKNAAPKEGEAAKTSADGRKPQSVPSKVAAPEETQDLSYLSKLTERKKELDLREASLTKLEEELQRQKSEIEEKIQQLEQIRQTIAQKLDEKVKVDEEKVTKLVEVYKSMKPSEAAKVLEKLDENLAVEIFDRMKQNKAGEIMGFLTAEKAKSISEKLTGYQRR